MATAEHPVNGTGDATGYSTIADTAAANLADAADPSAAAELQPPCTVSSAAAAADVNPAVNSNGSEKKWPGWPGHCVFRLIVPVLKVGSIIGRKGELIKKMCEETRARIRVLDAPLGTPDRIVLISGKEELDTPLSPAMDAVIRVFKRVCGLPESDSDSSKATAAACSIRFLVASTQAINLIGKQGSLIKSIQESTGASVRVLSEGELPVFAASDERIIDLQGEASKVLKAVEAVVGHLRKFLVDQSVLPLFEKTATHTATAQQDRPAETWVDKTLSQPSAKMGFGADYQLPAKRDLLFPDLESRFESQIKSSGLSLYGQDPGLSGIRPSRIGRAGAPIVTQVTQTMQIPLTYAEDIIGIAGANIAYIRRTSGAILTVQETRGMLDEITVEIKGSSSQVQTAQQLINEFINGHKEPPLSSYSKMDAGLRSYSQLGDAPYTSSSYTPQYGGYGSSSLGGFSSFRL